MSAQQKINNDQSFAHAKGSSANQTPESITIRPRHLHFDVKEDLATLWHSGDAFKTAFFNALSLQFPRGERHFIDSVRNYRDRVKDPALQENIRGFIGQEGLHSKEHEAYNEALAQRGYDLDAIDKRFSAHMDYVYSKRNHLRLAGTCAAEHYTAVLAHGLLNNPDWLHGASPRMQALWRWHAIEEIEHKSVAFDVYQSEIGIHKVRFIVFFVVTYNFFKYTFLNTCSMLKTEGKLWSLKTWLKGLNYLWGKPGVIRKCLPQLLKYLRRDFHPWQLDERQDLKKWSQHLEETGYGT
ncbi:metal-dependent hydrolase [Hahella sp. CCB-MM4]|uniref:metal-dependent hydrolase n=1 Tax=Hahella sp. (strain CCB-MM4) TaxID=1926491 RepID=UPI000B9C4CFE|nr:metal-dependent hydrolase [Hahella sp. CCB-MM4]OZG75526.1 metal-dependent hydrolase [Hahella sp. CCB-MM4]